MEDPDLEDPDPAPRQELSAVPFVVALVGVVILGALAYVYLREDGDLTAVRPDAVDTLDVAGDDMVEVTADDRPGCETLERVQVDLAEDTIFVEMVFGPEAGCVEAPPRDVTATVLLPEAIDGREVVAGFGRLRIPCDPDFRCTPDR